MATAAVLTIFWGMVSSVAAHPLHQASAEAHYNEAAKTLEVSMALYVNDLEATLTQRAGRAVNLATTQAKELDGMLAALLKDTFVLTNPAGSALTLTWVGRQMEVWPAAPSPSVSPAASPATDTPRAGSAPAALEQRLLLFFQFPMATDVEAHLLKINTLTDLFPDQKNLVQIHSGPRRAALAFSPSSLAKPIVLSEPPSSAKLATPETKKPAPSPSQ